MNKKISKRNAHRIFLDGILQKAVERGYKYHGKHLERSIHDEGLNVRIIPEFATHTGEMVFDVFIVVYFDLYEIERKKFIESTYENTKYDYYDIITILVSDIFKEDRDYGDDLYGYIQYFSSNFALISEFVEKNLSSRRNLLNYFENDEYIGGADRTLAIYTLICSTDGKDAACKWLRSGALYTAGEYQKKQLAYLLKSCDSLS